MTSSLNGQFDSRSLSGRCALVTGAAGGLGLAIAQGLANAGAKLILADLREREGIAAVEELCRSGMKAEFAHLDVTRPEDWATILSDRALDILVNCAGIVDRRGILDCDMESWRQLFAVNVDGSFLGIRAAAPAMRRTGGGSIVNVASAAAMGGHSFSAYASTKWAVRGLGRSAALELAPLGIRVNTICPGLFVTDINRGQPYLAALAAQVPLSRAGDPREIAELTCYLVSDAAAYVTGQEFVIDGGLTTGWKVPNPPTK